MVVAEKWIQACGQGEDTLAYSSHAFSHVQQQWGTLYGGWEYEGCFWEMVCEVQGRLGICRSCSCLWEISKFFHSAQCPPFEFSRGRHAEHGPDFMNLFLWSWIRVSNVNFSLVPYKLLAVPHFECQLQHNIGESISSARQICSCLHNCWWWRQPGRTCFKVRGNSQQTYYWYYFVYWTLTPIWPSSHKVWWCLRPWFELSSSCSPQHRRYTVPPAHYCFFFSKLLWGLPDELTHHDAGLMTPSRTTLHSGRPVTAIQFYNWKTGLMLSTGGIEMTMGITFQQTPWCFITNTGGCPANCFYLGCLAVMFIGCFFYELNTLPVCPDSEAI